jgi:hypothetical protein
MKFLSNINSKKKKDDHHYDSDIRVKKEIDELYLR